jgi:16S rRNA (guanine527-N7)-methyltransferase
MSEREALRLFPRDEEEVRAVDVLAAEVAALLPDDVAPATRDALGRYGALLLSANKATNLTGAKDAAAIAAHITDALTIARYVRSPLVDVGSGGGLPGIPLALATGAELTLIEATLKKARFLRGALDALGIAGRVVAERAEVAGHEESLRGRFAAVTARAVGGVTVVLEFTLPLLAVGGIAVLQRAPLSAGERNAASDAALVLGGEVTGYEVMGPGRSVLLVEQRTPTQPRFPRRTGIPTRKPLCAPGGASRR